MTHLCCTSCRLRFTPAAATLLTACPECGEPPQPVESLERTFGFRLVCEEGAQHPLPQAVAVAIPAPDPSGARS
jgi:predicted RNA-binding Zn-ribbon protein involved in translation (DUF1610 family)